MAKLTVATLKALVNTEVSASLIAQDSPFVPTYETLTGLLVKIGEQYSIDSEFEDKLGHLTHRTLEFGNTVEEWFNNLTLPVAHDPTGATNMAPKDPSFEDVAYSYQLPKYVAETTVRNEDIKKGFLGRSEFESLTAKIMKKLYDSQTLHRYFVKKQLIGRFIEAIGATATMREELAMPTDTATAETWAKKIKNKVEDMVDLITEDYNLRGVPARSPKLTLYVKPGLRSVLDIDLIAGAFNKDKAEIPVEMIVLEDFGTITGGNADAWAILVDDRGLRVYPSQNESDFDRNGQGGFTNYYLKEAYTAVYSKVINAFIWVAP